MFLSCPSFVPTPTATPAHFLREQPASLHLKAPVLALCGFPSSLTSPLFWCVWLRQIQSVLEPVGSQPDEVAGKADSLVSLLRSSLCFQLQRVADMTRVWEWPVTGRHVACDWQACLLPGPRL